MISLITFLCRKHIMINSNWSSNYKLLARKTPTSECPISDNAISSLVIDFRSRLFHYIRYVYVHRPMAEKIKCVYNILSGNIRREKINVFEQALIYTQDQIKLLKLSSCIYVFGSSTPCIFKQELRQYREEKRKKQWHILQTCLQKLGHHIIDLDVIIECSNAFEGYLLCCLDQLTQLYQKSKLVDTLEILVPNEQDFYESDKLLAQFDTVLTYDYDCVALFGAQMMITNVTAQWFEYVTLNDIMATFKSTTRTELIYRCCLLGTDYNKGWKGIGPCKVVKIDSKRLYNQVQSCFKLQNLDIDKFTNFTLQ